MLRAMKRLILSIILITFTSHIHALEVTIDGLSYYLNENNHEAIVSNGNKWHGKLHIPSVITYDRQTYETTGLNWNAFHDCSELTNIKISHTIEDVTHYNFNYEKILISPDLMNPFTGCTALESIEVAEDNPSMKSVDGVLFSKDGTRLYCYPAGIKATSYVVPQGVTWIGINAIANANLKKIDLPESVQTICPGAFLDCTFDVVIIRGHLDEQSISGGFIACLNKSAKLYVPTSEVERYENIFAGDVLPLEKNILPVFFAANQMATIILPTKPDASKGKYYRLDKVEGKEIVFEQELQPRAHVPYIIVPNEDFSIEVSAMELDGLRSDTASVEGISFIGTYRKEEVESQEGFYIELIDTTPDCSFSASGEAGREVYTIGTLRAYLLVHWDDPYHPGGTKAPAEKMEIVLHDNGTGIESIQNSKFKVQNEDAAIYDFSGRRLSKLQRGVNIIEGRKLMVK